MGGLEAEKHFLAVAMELCERISFMGAQPYFVGGYVRDRILGRESIDIDIVVVGLNSQQDLLNIFPKGQAVGKSFPVVLVDGFEIALARTERKIGQGHTAFDCNVSGVSLAQDLMRRDLTINAMAIDPFTGALIDPFNGQKDCLDKKLRPVTEAFKEDPLRVFRAARFAARFGFEVTPELVKMCEALVDEIGTLPAERVWNETELALNTPNPVKYFTALVEFNCLHVWFPALSNLRLVPAGPPGHHDEGNAFTHTMLALERARTPEGRWGVICHDLGKGVTDPALWPKQHNHEELGVPLVTKLNDTLKTPTKFKTIALLGCEHHLSGHKFQELRSASQHDLLMKIGRFLPYFEEICEADALGRIPAKKAYDYKDLTNLHTSILKIRALPEWGTGRIVGERLRQARISWLKKNYPNSGRKRHDPEPDTTNYL